MVQEPCAYERARGGCVAAVLSQLQRMTMGMSNRSREHWGWYCWCGHQHCCCVTVAGEKP